MAPKPDSRQRTASVTYDGDGPESLETTLGRNIEALCARRERNRRAETLDAKVAAAIGRFTGRMSFVYLHLLFFGVWIASNRGLIPFIPPWDESFVMLAMVASVEAIFLTTFVLITQNRTADAQRERAELDLQISLLTEHEITSIARTVFAIARNLGVGERTDLREVQRHVAPDAVLDRLGEAKT